MLPETDEDDNNYANNDRQQKQQQQQKKGKNKSGNNNNNNIWRNLVSEQNKTKNDLKRGSKERGKAGSHAGAEGREKTARQAVRGAAEKRGVWQACGQGRDHLEGGVTGRGSRFPRDGALNALMGVMVCQWEGTSLPGVRERVLRSSCKMCPDCVVRGGGRQWKNNLVWFRGQAPCSGASRTSKASFKTPGMVLFYLFLIFRIFRVNISQRDE